jgi:hypothetical protein
MKVKGTALALAPMERPEAENWAKEDEYPALSRRTVGA